MWKHENLTNYNPILELLLPGSDHFVLIFFFFALVFVQKVHITELIRHYDLFAMVAVQGVELHLHALNLCREYSEFRPVHGDGECFYRSFIFSYLVNVLPFPLNNIYVLWLTPQFAPL
jgi:hypothetical protein